MVAAPTYGRCGTLAPGPISLAFTSTYVPTLAAGPSLAPGRRYANGPTVAPRPTSAPSQWARSTRAPARTTVSVSVQSGPTCAPVSTRVVPCSWVPGCRVTSGASSTPASTQVVAGSRTVTP